MCRLSHLFHQVQRPPRIYPGNSSPQVTPPSLSQICAKGSFSEVRIWARSCSALRLSATKLLLVAKEACYGYGRPEGGKNRQRAFAFVEKASKLFVLFQIS